MAESKISRDRELLADKEGAGVSGPQCLASALVKLHAFTGIWDGFQKAAVEALHQGKIYINASKTYHEAVCRYAGPQALEGLSEVRVSHPTDSHPPLAVRLDNLGKSMGTIQDEALTVNPPRAALALVPAADTVEEAISEAYQSLLAHRLGIPFGPKPEQPTAASA